VIWSGVRAAEELLRLPNTPTAIACMNDEMAIGAIQAAHTQGLKIPEDISITGFDDISYSRYCAPPLTTIAQPSDDMGAAAVDTLLRMINDESPPDDERVFPFDFVIRQSTGPVKTAP